MSTLGNLLHGCPLEGQHGGEIGLHGDAGSFAKRSFAALVGSSG